LSECLSENMTIRSFSEGYFNTLPLPSSFDSDDIGEIKMVERAEEGDDKKGFTTPDGSDDEEFDFLDDIAEYLSENESGNLVILDSVSELISLGRIRGEWEKVFGFLAGLRRACTQWGCVLYAVLDRFGDSFDDYERLGSIPDGTIHFHVREDKNGFVRQMHVGSFRGKISKTEQAV
ncbi:MAG: hypothetical protein SV760_06810, partial [Halobacteria archaeon]|nr:hypothetical protein [Halobacteria archaeon]